MDNGLAYLVSKLLNKNNIKVDNIELKFQIQSHPSYPSLHAITGVLNHFNIDNLALDIPKNQETLTQLPNVFLAQIETDNEKEFVIVINKGSNYYLINTSKNNRTVTINEFLNQFTGIIVVVEKTELTNESNRSNNIYSKVLVGLSTITLIGSIYSLQLSLQSLLFLITSLAGLAISLTIKKQEQGKTTVLGNAFCSGESEKKDCNAVLASKGAMLFNNYKLSDLSIVYFLGLTFTTLLLLVTNQNAAIIQTISFTAVPITLYSIYYQAYVIKKWCLLCLSIVGVLWLQSSLFLIDNTILNLSTVLWLPAGLAAASFILTLTVYHQLSLKLSELNNLKKNKVDFYKFKRNFKLFDTLLQNSKTLTTIENQNFKGITIGNKEAKLNIAIITNPFCGHCKSVHTLVENIYRKYTEDVCIQIYFNVNPKNKEDVSVKVVTRLLEIYQVNGLEACMSAMHSIYNNQDGKVWLNKFKECSDLDYYTSILEHQYTWCTDNNINFTPEILVNGKSYPKEYDRSDLILFIEDLHENCCINTTEADLQLTT